jgi:hypothetical protein
MNCLPSPSGIRQVAQEYYASRVRRARLSAGVLLLASATHLLMTACLVTKVMDIAAYVGATICVLPLTCCLARAYAHMRASVRQARVRLAEIECLLRNAAGSVFDSE